MASPSLHILDVGHGNCCVAIDTAGVVLIDSGRGDVLLRFLESRRISAIKVVLISHADEDHIAGLLTLLLRQDVSIETIYLNPDNRRTKVWNAFRVAVADARKRTNTVVHTELTTTSSKTIHHGLLDFEILAPTPELAAGGPGSTDTKGRVVGSNTMSAVVRILHDGTPVALLPGDLDSVGFDNLAESACDANAQILVFPHHGGGSGTTELSEFARRLVTLVKPNLLVFSIGRGRHNTPQPEVIEGIKQASNTAHLMCTQLSNRCCATLPKTLTTGLARADDTQGNSCAGTISVSLRKKGIAVKPDPADHARFVGASVPTSLCQRAGPTTGPMATHNSTIV